VWAKRKVSMSMMWGMWLLVTRPTLLTNIEGNAARDGGEELSRCKRQLAHLGLARSRTLVLFEPSSRSSPNHDAASYGTQQTRRTRAAMHTFGFWSAGPGLLGIIGGWASGGVARELGTCLAPNVPSNLEIQWKGRT